LKVWLGASAASSPGSARLVVLTLPPPPSLPPTSTTTQGSISRPTTTIIKRRGCSCSSARVSRWPSTVPALRSTSPLHTSHSPRPPTSPPPPAPTHTGRLSDPRRRLASGCGEAAGRPRALYASSRLSSPAGSAVPAVPAVLVVLGPEATGIALPSDGMSTTRASSTLRLAVASPSS